MTQATLPADLLDGLPDDLAVLPGDARHAPYLKEWRGKFHGEALAVLRPRDTTMAAELMRRCYRHGIAMVPQAGNTGLVGGGLPLMEQTAVIVSVDRMSTIRSVDAANNTMTVEAGVTLHDVRQAAENADRLFPLLLGSEGSCRIGGNIASNAGGVLTLRYGNTREQVLGLEAVLPDGRIWDGLNGLRKNNTGYDLKQLFIGAEGTLGLITAACLRLQPRPRQYVTMLLALPSPAAALACLHTLDEASGGQVSSFEIMSRACVELAFRHIPGCQDRFAAPHLWYGLAELSGGGRDGDLAAMVTAGLASLAEHAQLEDALIAQSETQRAEFWHLREAIVEAQRHEGASIKHDIAVPISALPAFIDEGLALVERLQPGIRPTVFGHIGDGNLHFNMMQPVGMDRAAFLDRWADIASAVHALVMRHGGSFSAEHGIGQLKLDEMARYKSPVELDMMRAVKAALDPRGLMNPGKLLPP